MTIISMMDLSTSHLTKETADHLTEAHKNKSIYCAPHEFGWFVYVEEDVDPDMPSDLEKIFDYARKNRCSWIKFDCDAAVDEELPVYEWK